MNALDGHAQSADLIEQIFSSQKHKAALTAVLAELRAEFKGSLIGVVLCGSLALGNARADSDIDLVVLIGEKWSEVRRVHRSGIDVDLFIHWSAYAESQIPLGRLYPVLRMLSRGVVLVDTAGVARGLAEAARAIIDAPRPPVAPEELAPIRLTVLGYLRTLKGHTDDQAAEFALIMGRLINYCIEAYNAVHLRWDPPHKQRLADMGRRAPSLHRDMVRALDGKLSTAERVRSGQAVVRSVLGDSAETDDIVGPRLHHAGLSNQSDRSE